MRYPLFLCDFDGTLVRGDEPVSEETVAAIKKYRRAGGTFVVVTGRMLASILPRLRELGLTEGLVAAYQGAVVADIATGKRLKSEGFAKEDALSVIRFLERENVHIHVYSGDNYYSNRNDGLLRFYERICGVKGRVVADLPGFVEAHRNRVVKVLAMVSPSERDGLKKRAEKAFPDMFVTTSSEFLVEIMPKGQSKAAAVRYLSRRLSVPREKIAAIGDEQNDAPMLLAAGGRFAVESAADELKQIATVVPSVEENGVAYALLKYAMGEEK